MKENNNWFCDWFDSPYYHLLYSHRNVQEAKEFINRVTEWLEVKDGESALDLACGKGRHSLMLHEAGLNVTGLDLSPKSIKEASKFSEDGLKFVQADMRYFDLPDRFNYVFNFFTSFGYFGDQKENLSVLKRIHHHLKSGGLLLIDFLNPVEVEKELIPEEIIKRGDVNFHIKRYIQDGKIQKEIRFSDQGKEFQYKEEVQELRRSNFEELFKAGGFKTVRVFGDYKLNPFHEESSKRMILIAEKI